MTTTLIQRYLLPRIEEAMLDTPVVLVNGPRQAGKTTLVKHLNGLLRPTSGKEAKREAWEDLKRVLHYVYDDPPRPLSDF